MNILPDNLFSPTFKQQKLGFFFSAIMGIMVYLATLAMALQVGIATTTLSWDQSQKSRLTVEIPASETTDQTEVEAAKLVLTFLQADPAVASARLLGETDIAQLLRPWISDANLLRSLPLPSLIDVQIKDETQIPALQKRLATASTAAHISAHADWMQSLTRIVHALTALGWLLIALTGVALVIAINLICRTVLAVEQHTIELLHTLGATDAIIAATFARHTKKLSWPAAIIGFALAVGTVGALVLLLRAFSLGGSTTGLAWLAPASALLVVPCLAILGASLTARFAALSLLRHEP